MSQCFMDPQNGMAVAFFLESKIINLEFSLDFCQNFQFQWVRMGGGGVDEGWGGWGGGGGGAGPTGPTDIPQLTDFFFFISAKVIP